MKKIAVLLSTLFLLTLPSTITLADSLDQTKDTTPTSTDVVENQKMETQYLSFRAAKKYNLRILFANGFITEGQYNTALTELDNATTREEMQAIIDQLTGINTKASGYLFSFFAMLILLLILTLQRMRT
ncbi:hypothetical protein [Vagococcus sp.]|uniref:hypothetical protein n=1 Tax=Vagococcus sp. TaxID=1933889 RepID=UPI003F9E6183